MNTKKNYGLLAIAAAIVVVGLAALGVPLSILLVLALVAACPLMMLMMHGGHGNHGGHGDGGRHTDQNDPLRKHDDHHQHPGSGRS
ncbi:DUF2933 domain-containing protein [Streptomyces albogriseolus]|uniref:DUF2933 domain-containing protein n=2 Tax=unclassified Streptomyces TaxID=2593676 RepID=V9Z4E7_9ACTN|nr:MULTISPECIES: DUF2933 domain-containing protein [unclassified Streptomyces]AHE38923.1 Hypothetical protein pFRL3_146 [Streptomyces sp. FR1]AHE39407.1 Hypothetical protein pFRL4_174 [Streptomyces sp. F2]